MKDGLRLLSAELKRIMKYIIIGCRIKEMKITDVIFHDSYEDKSFFSDCRYCKYENCISLVLNDTHILILGDFNAEDHLSLDGKYFGQDKLFSENYLNTTWYVYAEDHVSLEQDRQELRNYMVDMKISRVSGSPLDCFMMILQDKEGKKHCLKSNRLWWDRIFLKGAVCYVR